MKYALALAALLPLAACGSDSASGDAPTPEAPVVDADTLAPGALAPQASGDAMPPTKTATMRVEGMEQQTTLTLAREDDFPIPFATYVPESMTAETVASGEGSAARFTLGDALLSVFVPSQDVADLSAWALEMAETMGEPSQLDAFPRWAEAAYSFGGVDVVGSVRAGRVDGRAFYVLETMPIEMGDGFAPRADVVLREWRWLESGTGFME